MFAPWMNHRWVRTLDGPPVERQFIQLFTGFYTSRAVQGFFHQQSPPCVDWVYHSYTVSTRKLWECFWGSGEWKMPQLLWPFWTQMYHFGCPSFTLWYEQKVPLYKRLLNLVWLVLSHQSKPCEVRWKLGRLGNQILIFLTQDTRWASTG